MKSFRPYIISIFLIIVLLALWSFQESPKSNKELSLDEKVRLAVDTKLADRKKKRMDRCKELALKKAEDMVDSMLVAQAKLIMSDTIDKPPKPPKPDLLEIKKAKDKTPIKPLFDENAIKIDATEIEQSDTTVIKY